MASSISRRKSAVSEAASSSILFCCWISCGVHQLCQAHHCQRGGARTHLLAPQPLANQVFRLGGHRLCLLLSRVPNLKKRAATCLRSRRAVLKGEKPTSCRSLSSSSACNSSSPLPLGPPPAEPSCGGQRSDQSWAFTGCQIFLSQYLVIGVLSPPRAARRAHRHFSRAAKPVREQQRLKCLHVVVLASGTWVRWLLSAQLAAGRAGAVAGESSVREQREGSKAHAKRERERGGRECRAAARTR